jgi:hypothetical protein
MSMRTSKCSCIVQPYVILILTIFLSACGGAAGGALWGMTESISASANKTEITPIMPYQEGDENLNCTELNKEIGRIQERMSRLMEQNEKAEIAKEESRSFSTHIQQFGIVSIITYPISAAFHSTSKEDKEKYGTEDIRIVQAYQERVKYLESIGKSKGC